MHEDGQIDYSNYTLDELLQSRESINRQLYPKNYENLLDAIRTAESKPEVVRQEREKAAGESARSRLVAAYVMMAFLSVYAFYLAYDGFLSRSILIDPPYRGFSLEVYGDAAVVGSVGLAVLGVAFLGPILLLIAGLSEKTVKRFATILGYVSLAIMLASTQM